MPQAGDAHYDNFFFLAVEQTADSVVITDRHGLIEYVNPAFEELTGFPAREVLGRPLGILKSDHHPRQFYASLWKTLRAGSPFRAEFANRKKNGDIFFEEKIISPIRGDDGTITHFVSAGRDVTEKKQSEQQRAQLTAVQEATTDLVAIMDSQKRLTYLNLAGRRMLKLSDEGTLPAEMTIESAGVFLPQEALATATEGGAWNGETEITLANGAKIPVSMVLVTKASSDGQIDFIAAVARDLSHRRRVERELRYAAEHDALTGAYNRRRFEEELERAVGCVDGQTAAVLLVDLDDFKTINDSLGHWAGDQVLRYVAQMLKETKRPTDVFARLGGDEFAILLDRVDERKAVDLAMQTIKVLRNQHLIIAGKRIRLTASIGLALVPAHGQDVDELMTNADVALYEAKQRGRNTARVYNPQGDARDQSRTRLDTRNSVLEALDHGLFRLFCQPILNLHSPEIDKYELLLRVGESPNDLDSPRELLDVAEQTGLIREIDRWVVHRAVALIAGQERPTQISVNLSATSVATKGFQSVIMEELAATNADPAMLIIEITETAAIRDFRAAKRFVRELKGIGCQFALDDFGIGFSSFVVARDLPVDYLKIDGAFVANLSRNKMNQHIIRAIVEFARATSRQTVAEFVDSRSTARHLEALGVDFAQGFYIGRPVPVEHVFPVAHEEPGAFKTMRQAA